MEQEYRLIVKGFGEVEIQKSDGSTLAKDQAELLAAWLTERYETKRFYLYIAVDPENASRFKIGITERSLQEREREIKGVMIHSVRCSSKQVRRLEKVLLLIFARYAVGHEWFELGADAETFKEWFVSCKSQKELTAKAHKALFRLCAQAEDKAPYQKMIRKIGFSRVRLLEVSHG